MDCVELLQRQKQAAIDAQKRKGQKATGKASRTLLEMMFMKQRLSAAEKGTLMRTCFIGYAYPPSVVPISQLQPIGISDLRLETHHRGKVLYVRTFGHPYRMLAVQNAVEDAKGDVDRLSLYNDDPSLQPEQLLPKGAHFAIKEPYYKATVDGGYSIRVDHPSDLVPIQLFDTPPPSNLMPRSVQLEKTAIDFKQEGNAAYAKKDYITALKLYSFGVAACKSEHTTLRCDLFRNRAIVNQLLSRYEPAEANAQAAILPATEPLAEQYNVKAYFRAGRAAYELGNFISAEKHFSNALKLSPQDAESLKEHKRTIDRLEEESTGIYDFAQISNTKTKTHYRLDHASFLRNTEVRKAGPRGRGLFATKDIMAGELVLCEKAFSVVFRSDKADIYTIVNLNTNRASIGTQVSLLFNLVQKLRYNPKQAAGYLSLYDGGYSPKCKASVVDNVTVIDVFHTVAISEHNCFGCPNVRSVGDTSQGNTEDEPLAPAGIWIRASYINHACDGNARRAFSGDLMIIRAIKNISKDEEIFMPYKTPDADNLITIEKLQKTWGFTCKCAICTAEAKTAPIQREQRRKLLVEAEHFLFAYKQSMDYQPNKTLIGKAEELFHKLEATYDEKVFKGLPRLGLIHLSNWLCQAYSQPKTPRKCLTAAVLLLRNLGFGVAVTGKTVDIDRSSGYLHPMTPDAAVYAAHANLYLKDVALAEQFGAFAKEAYGALYGDLLGFDERYGNQLA